MGCKKGNYSAFYVEEPFSQIALGAHASRDFNYYNLLRAWNASDSSMKFVDSHDTTYNVRDDSDWETTLKPRLRERLRNSKNIILFLSSVTKSSRALREEIEYGINNLELPVIVIYPELEEKEELLNYSNDDLNSTVKNLWDKLPVFRDSKWKVPVLHIPMKKEAVILALKDEDLMINTKIKAGDFFYKV